MAEATYLEAIRQGLFEEMERDPSVFCMGEDIGAYGGAFKVTDGLSDRFGESRVIDTPISEIAIVGAAAGAGHMGMRPVVEMQFIDFIANAYDMLTNYVATARYRAFLPCPMVVRGPSGGYVRGGPFHSQNPEAGFIHTPGLKVVYPATAEDAKGLMKSAILARGSGAPRVLGFSIWHLREKTARPFYSEIGRPGNGPADAAELEEFEEEGQDNA